MKSTRLIVTLILGIFLAAISVSSADSTKAAKPEKGKQASQPISNSQKAYSEADAETFKKALPTAKIVLVCKVDKVKVKKSKKGKQIDYTLSPKEALFGTLPQRMKITCFYKQPPSGTGTGSGKEFLVKKGKRYLFLFDNKEILNKEPVAIFMVEDENLKPVVFDYIKNLKF